jgi:hypothetical protein
MPPFVWDLVDRLRRRGLGIGVDDCAALRAALATGRGLRSDAALRDLCVALWAKSADEARLVATAFTAPDLPRWDVAVPEAEPDDEQGEEPEEAEDSDEESKRHDAESPAEKARTEPALLRAEEIGLGVVPPPDLGGDDAGLFLVPRFPLSAREVAQVWRRLSRPSRSGPRIDVDAGATLDRLARSGVATPPVLAPSRANRTTLLVLVDRDGSMSPYHGWVEHVVRAIATLGRLDAVTVRYFHDVPGASGDRGVLAGLTDRLSPRLDAVLTEIHPLPALRVYRDTSLARPGRLEPGDLLGYTSIVVVGDAGAARGRLDADRLIDTIAFGRALRQAPHRTVAWLNPAEPDRWRGTTAEQVARHLPMFPMTRAGMSLAVDVLRGRPPALDRPL